MIIKDWSSKDNWWLQEGMDFNRIWQSVVLTYADRAAYFKHGTGVSYVDLENEARVYRYEAMVGFLYSSLRLKMVALITLLQIWKIQHVSK